MKVDYSSTALEVDTIQPIDNVGVTVDGDLFVDGHLHYTSITSPFWAAGRVNGITSTILSSKGRHAFTFERLQQGYYKMTWAEPHPDGANFLCFEQGEGTGSTWNILHDANDSEDLANSANSVTFITMNNAFGITDGILSWAVVA